MFSPETGDGGVIRRRSDPAALEKAVTPASRRNNGNTAPTDRLATESPRINVFNVLHGGVLHFLFTLILHLMQVVGFCVCVYLLLHAHDSFYPAEMTKRDVPGFAIGGLSGGEEKDDFWKMVTLSTDHLPREKPRYLMGVG